MEKGEIFDLWTVKMIRRRTLSLVREENRVWGRERGRVCTEQ